MEILKTLIPEEMKRSIYVSTTEDLPSTCTSLLDFFRSLPRFHQVVRELSDPEFSMCGKDQKSALSMKEKGNGCFRGGNYPEALRCYTKALRLAPLDIKDMDKNIVAALFVNRASAMHKMGLLEESIRDCNHALVVFPCYGKLNNNPLKESELILYGGEYYNGNKTFVYGDLYRYNVEKLEWKLVSSPNSPPPRSAHQSVAWKDHLYVFGGEFTSPNQERFHHYKDFWMLNLKSNQWEQLLLKGAPTPRSGHRMIRQQLTPNTMCQGSTRW